MNAPASSALRQPLVWLVIALPLLSVVAGVSLLFVASDPLDAVGDSVKRTAQVQETDLSRDFETQRLGLKAQARRTGDTIEVAPLGAGFARAVPLELILRHPLRASEDRVATLAPTRAGWTARVEGLDAGHDWILELAPTDRRWRLVGRWQAGAPNAALQPALGPAQ